MIASQQESPVLQTDASDRSLADSLGLSLPVDEDESPIIIDTTQAIIPE